MTGYTRNRADGAGKAALEENAGVPGAQGKIGMAGRERSGFGRVEVNIDDTRVYILR